MEMIENYYYRHAYVVPFLLRSSSVNFKARLEAVLGLRSDIVTHVYFIRPSKAMMAWQIAVIVPVLNRGEAVKVKKLIYDNFGYIGLIAKDVHGVVDNAKIQ